MSLPQLLGRTEIRERLRQIFPEGTPHRGYCTRDLAASTVFCGLYVGAIEGSGGHFGPKHVYRMTDKQAAKDSEKDRLAYAAKIMGPRFTPPGKRWYSDNTREPIRDETLREGLVQLGAVLENRDVPTTSSKPRYALTLAFAHLFDPTLTGSRLEEAIQAWQFAHLNKGALARIALIQRGAAPGGEYISLRFPNEETRRLAPGPSSQIAKAVIEEFAVRFLAKPAVLLLSESGNKIVARDDQLAEAIGLKIDIAKNLPDIVLVDLGPRQSLLIFVEVVATDGPINSRRKQALEQLASAAGFDSRNTAFVTAYADRSSPAFKKTVDVLAWGSYAWFASEPACLIKLSDNADGID